MLQRKLMRVTVSFVDEIFLKNRTQMTTSAQLYHVSTTLSRQHKMAQAIGAKKMTNFVVVRRIVKCKPAVTLFPT